MPSHQPDRDGELDVGRRPRSPASARAGEPSLAGIPSQTSPSRSPTPASHSSRTGPGPPPPPKMSPKTDLRTHSLLVAFSFVGCLARLGLNALFAYPGQQVFPLVWSQGVGCLLMGMCVVRKNEIESWGGKALYVGLGTGLCGSITTFSSWMLQSLLQFANLEPHVAGRTGVHDTIAGLTHLIQTLAFSFFSFHLGRHLAAQIPPLPTHRPLHASPIFRWLTLAIPSPLYLVLLLLAIFSDRIRTDRALLITLLLAPPGTILRYQLGLLLNPVFSHASPPAQKHGQEGVGEEQKRRQPRRTLQERLSPIPILGTLSANLLATLILSIAFLVQRTPSLLPHTTVLACQVEQAIEDGFCGSLSTVSTLVSELDGTKGWRRWAYLVVSVAGGLVIVLAVVGGGEWSGEGLGQGCRL